MAYDENLADRVRALLEAEAGFSERKMFGGIAFMLDGHMCCGVVGSELMLRLGTDGSETALEHPDVRPMDFTGRPISSMVFVAPEGLQGVSLRTWVGQAATFARSLTPSGSERG
jgi:TfoX/Sxy family transcriptional regulator of competence genes